MHGPVDIPGTYYTVNPEAVTEVDFDVFTANRRQVMYIKEEVTGKIVAFVAVGALLVGSIGWSKKVGERVERAEELGWFAYGGSTVLLIFPQGMVQFDEDLVVNSEHALETLVKVGNVNYILYAILIVGDRIRWETPSECSLEWCSETAFLVRHAKGKGELM